MSSQQGPRLHLLRSKTIRAASEAALDTALLAFFQEKDRATLFDAFYTEVGGQHSVLLFYSE